LVKKKESVPLTRTGKLSNIIKSARDIMRKDKGLNGDLDRLPQLTWIMFLKFIDDMEKIHQTETELQNNEYIPIIKSPYRWRDWAIQDDGITGPELISFVNNDEVDLPDGTRGFGLLSYLQSLHGESELDKKDIISSVYRGISNRMLNGYLLRDVINKINLINFSSSNEIHTLSYIYETILKQLRDSAGDSGEFYTPRSVIRFIVNVMNLKIGQTILDPACGTGGFLVESYKHLEEQCKNTKQREILQTQTIQGVEAKSLPYLLCQMNLLMHGMELPNIDPLNALRFPLREIGDKERVDVVLTNPPFGGEEEKGILSNFPDDKQTSETALLFLQLIMRKLKRKKGNNSPGKCAIVMPNGILYGGKTTQIIREELLTEFNLHTIVRLPDGIFAPYTPIPTNILFFEHGGPTEEIWYYELPVATGRKQYTKTRPILFEHFQPLIDWWTDRKKNQFAWSIKVSSLKKTGYDLDQFHPNRKTKKLKPPTELVTEIQQKISNISSNLEIVKETLEKNSSNE
jgi:type I restriction enzyme M protein